MNGPTAHFAFVYHNDQLAVEVWHDLLLYQKMVKEANADLPWTAGDISVLEKGLEISFRHSSTEEFQGQAIAAIKDWFKKRSEDDPEYVFAFYKTFLEILPFHHNLQPDDLARRLLHHFNMRQESASWQNSEGEWAFGDVWMDDDAPRVEFTHISNPETQKNALKAISQWHDEEKLKNYDVEWELIPPQADSETT